MSEEPDRRTASDEELSAALNSGLFTEDEYAAYFGPQSGDDDELAPRSARLGRPARLLGLFVALAMVSGGLFGLINSVITSPDLRDPIEIEAAAWARAAQSEFGWLVEDIVIEPIDAPRVGGFVTKDRKSVV